MNQQEPPQEKIHSVIELFANKKKQEAIDKVNDLIKDYPKSSLLLNLVGTFYKAIGMLEEAVQSFENPIIILKICGIDSLIFNYITTICICREIVIVKCEIFTSIYIY